MVEEEIGEQSTGLAQEADPNAIIDDDDNMNIPAPDASVFQHKIDYKAGARAKASARRNLELQRTFIPICLTVGLILLIYASLKYIGGPDSMLAILPSWIPTSFAIGGVVMLILGGINMLSVKKRMDAANK